MTPPVSFLRVAEPSDGAQALFDDDTATHGFVMNASQVWAHQPRLHDDLFTLLAGCVSAGQLSMRDRGILVTATAAARGDSYCSLAWGGRLAAVSSPEFAASVLRANDEDLTGRDLALAQWARNVVQRPNDTTASDVEALRVAGLDDAQILAVTLFVGLRLAFSTVNDALGALPDRQLLDETPDAVREAVTFGRPASRP